MRYSKIITYDTANSHGFSTTIWFTGCPFHCEGCFNSEIWDSKKGKPFDRIIKNKVKETLKNKNINNLVLLGGEPLSYDKRKDIVDFCKEVKLDYPEINIIVYTGYYYEEIEVSFREKLFPYIDYLIDGRYEEKYRTNTRQLRGSTNQNCYFIAHLEDVWICTNVTEKYFF